MKTLLLIVALGALLAASVWQVGPLFAAYAHEISIHGWIALAAGTIVSLALGGGLMALSFFSARRGYDERADWRAPDEEDGQQG
jgi:hypothetical protein